MSCKVLPFKASVKNVPGFLGAVMMLYRVILQVRAAKTEQNKLVTIITWKFTGVLVWCTAR